VSDGRRVILEIGMKRRTAAGATATYLSRYTGDADRVGLPSEFARVVDIDVV
jgi:hypothetical protein